MSNNVKEETFTQRFLESSSLNPPYLEKAVGQNLTLQSSSFKNISQGREESTIIQRKENTNGITSNNSTNLKYQESNISPVNNVLMNSSNISNKSGRDSEKMEVVQKQGNDLTESPLSNGKDKSFVTQSLQAMDNNSSLHATQNIQASKANNETLMEITINKNHSSNPNDILTIRMSGKQNSEVREEPQAMSRLSKNVPTSTNFTKEQSITENINSPFMKKNGNFGIESSAKFLQGTTEKYAEEMKFIKNILSQDYDYDSETFRRLSNSPLGFPPNLFTGYHNDEPFVAIKDFTPGPSSVKKRKVVKKRHSVWPKNEDLTDLQYGYDYSKQGREDAPLYEDVEYSTNGVALQRDWKDDLDSDFQQSAMINNSNTALQNPNDWILNNEKGTVHQQPLVNSLPQMQHAQMREQGDVLRGGNGGGRKYIKSKSLKKHDSQLSTTCATRSPFTLKNQTDEDALSGSLAQKVVSKILRKVQASPKLVKELGMHESHVHGLDLPAALLRGNDSSEVRKEVVKEVVSALNKLPEMEARQECVPMTPELKSFLSWLVEEEPEAETERSEQASNAKKDKGFWEDENMNDRLQNDWLDPVEDYEDYPAGLEDGQKFKNDFEGGLRSNKWDDYRSKEGEDEEWEPRLSGNDVREPRLHWDEQNVPSYGKRSELRERVRNGWEPSPQFLHLKERAATKARRERGLKINSPTPVTEKEYLDYPA